MYQMLIHQKPGIGLMVVSLMNSLKQKYDFENYLPNWLLLQSRSCKSKKKENYELGSRMYCLDWATILN